MLKNQNIGQSAAKHPIWVKVQRLSKWYFRRNPQKSNRVEQERSEMESLYNLVKELYLKIQSEHYSNIMITKLMQALAA